jgi:hypothetical protein
LSPKLDEQKQRLKNSTKSWAQLFPLMRFIQIINRKTSFYVYLFPRMCESNLNKSIIN